MIVRTKVITGFLASIVSFCVSGLSCQGIEIDKDNLFVPHALAKNSNTLDEQDIKIHKYDVSGFPSNLATEQMNSLDGTAVSHRISKIGTPESVGIASSGTFRLPSPGKLIVMSLLAMSRCVTALPERSSTLWYPSFICAKSDDVQRLTYYVNDRVVQNNFVNLERGYERTPYTDTPGYVSASACSYASWASWLHRSPHPAYYSYSDPNCTVSGSSYYLAQPYYTISSGELGATLYSFSTNCVQAPANAATKKGGMAINNGSL